jgi:hypothetical protein
MSGTQPLEIAGASIANIHSDPHIARTIEGVDQSEAAAVAVTHPTSTSPGMIVAMATLLTHHLQTGHIGAIGHRIAHGGRPFTGPVVATDEIPGSLSGLSCLSPIEKVFENFPSVKAEAVAAGVFEVLRMYISPGEIENVLQALPKPIRHLCKALHPHGPDRGAVAFPQRDETSLHAPALQGQI